MKKYLAIALVALTIFAVGCNKTEGPAGALGESYVGDDLEFNGTPENSTAEVIKPEIELTEEDSKLLPEKTVVFFVAENAITASSEEKFDDIKKFYEEVAASLGVTEGKVELDEEVDGLKQWYYTGKLDGKDFSVMLTSTGEQVSIAINR